MLLAAWALCLGALYATTVTADYRLHDPDSTLYESIAVQLSARPVSEWIAPDFPPHRFKEGLFVEHTAVFFWPAAALGKLGFSRGALLANFVYFLLSLFFLHRLVRALAGEEAAWAAVLLYVVSPLGLQYLVRANHEHAWGLSFLAGLYCLSQLSRSALFGAGFALAGLCAVAIKGALALSFFPVMLAAWWVLSRRRHDLAWFAVCLALVGLTALAYELAFHRATGQSFLRTYLDTQVGYVADAEDHVWQKLFNPLYYLGNLVWLSLPGSLLAAWASVRGLRRGAERTRGLKLFALCGLVLLALLSLMTRRAARYVFPAYALAQVPAAELVCEKLPGVRAFLERRRALLPYLLMALLLCILPVRLWASLKHYRFINPF